MRITVDIEDSLLKELVAITGETKKSPAVSRAVEEFIKRKKASEFGRLLREGFFADAWPEDFDPEKSDK